jgi:hypothetical protein
MDQLARRLSNGAKFENLTLTFDVIEAKVGYLGKSLFGQIRSNSLALSGFLFEATSLGPYSK